MIISKFDSAVCETEKMTDNVVGHLSEDMIIKILPRLPTKSLFRFKCVCKRWHDLIEHDFSSKALPSNMMGFFCRPVLHLGDKKVTCSCRFYVAGNYYQCDAEYVDTNLLFLPTCQKKVIVDSCNGLVLCCPLDVREGVGYYVCNTATKKWDLLPKSAYNKIALVPLAFDPHISPHNKILWVKPSNYGSEPHFFCSENPDGNWQKLPYRIRSRQVDTYHNCSVFSDGALYITFQNIDGYIVIMFKLYPGTHRVISLPPGYVGVPFIGILGGSICCAELPGHRMRI